MTDIAYTKNKGIFFSVLADGKFHRTVDEGTEGAVRRDYETSDGTKGVKYELVAEAISGVIKTLSIYEGDYGKNIQILFEGDEEIIVSLSASSNFGEDFLKKLANIDVSKEVKLSPYSFEDDKGKRRKGVTVYQGDEKVIGFYHRENKKTKKWEVANGYPKVPKEAEKWDSDDWRGYFLTARKFLLSELTKHELYKDQLQEAPEVKEKFYPKDDADPSKIEF